MSTFFTFPIALRFGVEVFAVVLANVLLLYLLIYFARKSSVLSLLLFLLIIVAGYTSMLWRYPDSEQAAVLRSNATVLSADHPNRNGELAQDQSQWLESRMIPNLTLDLGCIFLGIYFVLQVFFPGLTAADPPTHGKKQASALSGLASALVGVVFGLFFLLHTVSMMRDVAEQKVEATSGNIGTQESIRSGCSYAIGSASFSVDCAGLKAVKPGKPYTIYFAKQSKEVVAVEPLISSP